MNCQYILLIKIVVRESTINAFGQFSVVELNDRVAQTYFLVVTTQWSIGRTFLSLFSDIFNYRSDKLLFFLLYFTRCGILKAIAWKFTIGY